MIKGYFAHVLIFPIQADAIMSRMNISDYRKDGADPTLLISSDIVCLILIFSKSLCHQSNDLTSQVVL